MASIEAERRMRERYMSEETGLRPAVFETMRRLYSLPRLPANPYFFVATQLSAHSAHSATSVWAVRAWRCVAWRGAASFRPCPPPSASLLHHGDVDV